MKKKVFLAVFGSAGLIAASLSTALLTSRLSKNQFAKAKAEQIDLVARLCGGSSDNGVRSFVKDDFEFKFQFQDVTFGADYISIAPGGYLRNVTAINGLESITFGSANENLAVSAGKLTINGIERYHFFSKEYDVTKIADSYSFTSRESSHIVLQNIDDTTPVVINEMNLNYSCEGTVDTPTVESLATAYDNYTWDFLGGGSESTPFLIRNTAEWEKFTVTYQKNYTGFHFKLMNDITVTTAQEKDFKGHFDGGNHTITANISSTSDVFGLFCTLDGVGTIKDLTLEGSVVTTGADVGGIVGTMRDTRNSVTNCVNKASVTGKFSFGNGIGGIVGRAVAGSIINCVNESSSLNATGTTKPSNGVCVGGILGSSYINSGVASTTITGCKNFGSLSTECSYIGGIVGFANRTALVIENCQNGDETHHPVISGYQQVAGILGSANSNIDQTNSLIDGCKNYGTVRSIAASGYNTGGIIGQAYCPVTNCDNYGEVVETTGSTHPTAVVGSGLGWIIGKAAGAGSTGSSNNNNHYTVS